MPNNMPTVSQLKSARAMMQMTQDQIAMKAGLSAKTVTGVEAGKSSLGAYYALVGAYLGMGIRFTTSPDLREQTVTRIYDEPDRNPGIHLEHMVA